MGSWLWHDYLAMINGSDANDEYRHIAPQALANAIELLVVNSWRYYSKP